VSTPQVDTTPIDRLVVALVYSTTSDRRFRARSARLMLKVLGVDWRPRVVGAGLRMPHSTTGSVVHPKTVIGRDVTIMQGVTIGRSDSWRSGHQEDEGVVVESSAVIGANAVVLFRAGQRLVVGSGSVIGAGSVLLASTGPGEIWAGNPARLVGKVD
jgi:serine O-acetyltransferase